MMYDLRTARERERLSQEGLAHILGLSPSLIADLETGRTAASPTIRHAIEEVLGCRIDWIVTRFGRRPETANYMHSELELARQIEAYVMTGAGRKAQAARIHLLNSITETIAHELELDT